MPSIAFCHIYAQLDQLGEELEQEIDNILNKGLICDASFSFEQGEKHAQSLRNLIDQGGLAAPNIYPQQLDKSVCDQNWWKLSVSECVRLLKIAQEKYAQLGIGEMQAVNTYTPGNSFVEACRELNIEYILGFCAPITIEDGAWQITHYGAPLSPFFVSDEDFRKPEKTGLHRQSVLMSSMELRNPAVCLEHWSEGPWCPLNAQAADRWLEPGPEPLAFIAVAQDWMEQSRLTGKSLLFHANLQYFFAGRCKEHNHKALDWLAAMCNEGRLENGSLQKWAEKMRNNNGFIPQTSYWRSEMPGFHVGSRPGFYPDVIVNENLKGQTIWRYPDCLPFRHYNYSSKWNIPQFEPDGTAPASENFSFLNIQTNIKELSKKQRLIEINLENTSGKSTDMKIAIWDAFKGLRVPFTFSEPEGFHGTLVPHPSGTGAALLLEGKIEKANYTFTIKAEGRESAGERLEKNWGNLIAARTIRLNNCPCTYISSMAPASFSVTLRKKSLSMPQEEPCKLESLCGIRYESRDLCNEPVTLRFDATKLSCFHRIWGIYADEIEIDDAEQAEEKLRTKTQIMIAETQLGLTTEIPGYRIFKSIKKLSLWEQKLALAKGEKEIKKVNEYLRKFTDFSGDFKIEAHPGIFLPPGSLQRTHSRPFTHVVCSDGFTVHDRDVDYAQAWDWGVSAWVQWRQLSLAISGMQGKKGNFKLHIHAFDPESRGISQRVHFFDASKSETQRMEICGRKFWKLPQGLDKRFEKSAFISIEIPEECMKWESLGVWICPLEDHKLYDWIHEQGSPGLLSHLWLTHEL